MTDSTIRLLPNLCDSIIAALYAADWEAQERGDTGSEIAWERDGDRFDWEVQESTEAIDAIGGLVYGARLAKSLEMMATIEKRWGDDPLTQVIRGEIARVLDWDITGRDLLVMLRSGG